MIRNITTLLSLIVLLTTSVGAQQMPDLRQKHLNGPVISILTTERGAHNQIIGQPVREFYTTNGYLEHLHYYDTAGNAKLTMHYRYDKKMQLVATNCTLEPFTQLLSVTNYSFDKKSRCLTAELIAIEDTITTRALIYLDKMGRCIRQDEFDENKEQVSRTEYNYDQFGNMVKAVYFRGPNNNYINEEHYRYDTEGNCVEKATFHLNVCTHSELYTYFFDEQGNWTDRYSFSVTAYGANLLSHTNRKIDYQSKE